MTLVGLASAIVRHIQGSSQEQIESERACLDNVDWQNKTAKNRIWCRKSLRQTCFLKCLPPDPLLQCPKERPFKNVFPIRGKQFESSFTVVQMVAI